MEYMPYAIDAIRLRSGMYGIPLVPLVPTIPRKKFKLVHSVWEK